MNQHDADRLHNEADRLEAWAEAENRMADLPGDCTKNRNRRDNYLNMAAVIRDCLRHDLRGV